MCLMFQKGGKKKKRRRHTRSILQDKDGTCFLCMLRGDYTRRQTEEHHIFYGPNREVSEAEGLKVYLCHAHHQYSYAADPEAVHGNPKSRDSDLLLKRLAQEEYEKTHTREEFLQLIGKNYLE